VPVNFRVLGICQSRSVGGVGEALL
jgi:hypothetical protein